MSAVLTKYSLRVSLDLSVGGTHRFLADFVPLLHKAAFKLVKLWDGDTSPAFKNRSLWEVHDSEIRAWWWPGKLVPKVWKILLAPLLCHSGPTRWGRVLLKCEKGFSILGLGPQWYLVLQVCQIDLLVDLDALQDEDEGSLLPIWHHSRPYHHRLWFLMPEDCLYLNRDVITLSGQSPVILGVAHWLDCKELLVCVENWTLHARLQFVEENLVPSTSRLWPRKELEA